MFAVCLVVGVTGWRGKPAAAFPQNGLPDRVVIRPQGTTGRIVLQCAILDYTGQTLSVKTITGATRRFQSSQVIDVQTPQTNAHRQGLVAFTTGEYARAAAEFESALGIEERGWVRRELLALIVRCALKQGDYLLAGRRFVPLLESDPTTQHDHLIPLLWVPQIIPAPLQTQARRWLLGEKPTPRLLGASILLNDSQYGKTALEALRQLRSATDSRLSALAEWQLWRAELIHGAPNDTTLALWQQRLQRLPPRLRAGPYYLLGRAHQLRGEKEQAAAAFLWLPLVYDDDRLLAARACLEAADSLAEAGQKREALMLYREVEIRFSQTEFAQEAAAQRQKLTSTAAAP